MQEKSLGSRSIHAPLISSMPRADQLHTPLFWTPIEFQVSHILLPWPVLRPPDELSGSLLFIPASTSHSLSDISKSACHQNLALSILVTRFLTGVDYPVMQRVYANLIQLVCLFTFARGPVMRNYLLDLLGAQLISIFACSGW